jgi:Ras family protein T1
MIKRCTTFRRNALESRLSHEDLENIKLSISKSSTQDSDLEKGIDQSGFILLNKIFAEKGRHETVWIILREVSYTRQSELER